MLSFCRLMSTLIAIGGVIYPSIYSQSVRNNIDKDTLRIGDILEYRLIIQQESNTTEVRWPDSTFFKPSFELYEKKQYRISNRIDSIVYRLQFFDNQSGTIARFPVTFISDTDTINRFAPAVAYYFVSVIKNDSTLKDVKGNFTFERDYSWLWWIFIVILFLVIIGFYIWRYIKKRQIKPATSPEQSVSIPIFVNPLKELKKKLLKLKEDGAFLITDDHKSYYVQLGDSIRTYIEQMHKVNALEMTTGELLIELKKVNMNLDLIDSCSKILQVSDLVKFARFHPMLNEVEQSWKEAWQFYIKVKEIDKERLKKIYNDYRQQYPDKENLDIDYELG